MKPANEYPSADGLWTGLRLATDAGVEAAIVVAEGAIRWVGARSALPAEFAGLAAHDGRVSHRLDVPHRPFAFSGDDPIDCTLLGGASNDFNVMTRHGQWRAEVQVLDRATAIEAAPHGVLLALRGAWRLDDERCTEGEGLYWTDSAQAWQAVPAQEGARLAAVRIVPA